MAYKRIVIDYARKAKKRANEMARQGWELVTFSLTNSAKAILVFHAPEAAAQQSAVPEETAEAVGDAE